jgi:hypothetical protein
MSGLERCEAAHRLANARPGTMELDSNTALWDFIRRRKKPMEFADRVLKCVECNTEFVFTAMQSCSMREIYELNLSY